MRGLMIDADAPTASLLERLRRPSDPVLDINRADPPAAADLPRMLRGYDFVLDDHTELPTDALSACPDLRHVIFLGTGAASYMDVTALASRGIRVHTIKGYADTAVAEHTIALMWAAARDLARMDRSIRAGGWPGPTGIQLTGKTLGLIGFGGIAAEVARIACGSGMRVLAWNRTARAALGVTFVDLDLLLTESHVLSLHLLLTEETRGFLGAERLHRVREGVILVNTARAALVDEAAMIAALRDGRIAHAALDVFTTEPLPAGHAFTRLDNVTLSAHSGFRTAEASEALIGRALDIARTL
ncbi:MAG: 3-phosphoglycerate dehydrogenase [Acetobacteraceae bacterium]|nr:3-phosphoglycerate dehydrogenase [Acetobacteraceae bacterium]